MFDYCFDVNLFFFYKMRYFLGFIKVNLAVE